jgi:hypothetical protein
MDRNVTNDVVYYYAVTAVGDLGEGPASHIEAHPRKGANITSYSPRQVDHCDPFFATIE